MAVPKVNLRSIRRKGSTVYLLDYTVGGKRIREAVGSSKRDAELLRANLQSDLTRGRFDVKAAKPNVISLAGLAKEFLFTKQHVVRKTSQKRYENYLDMFLAFFEKNFSAACHDVRNIKMVYVKECFDELLTKNVTNDKPWSRKTVNGLRTIVKTMFQYGIRRKYLEENPLEEIKSLPIPKNGKAQFFSDEELGRLWKAVDPFWLDHLQFLVNTGLRKAEMINLQWPNVQLEGNDAHITVTSYDDWETKTGATRRVPLNDIAIAILKKWVGKHETYVFTQKEGGKIHPDKPYRAMQQALGKINVEGDIHKLRHTFASKLVMSGVDLYTVKELLGHSDIKSTQIYAHLLPSHLRAAVKKLEE